jgi:hypothetical protein
MAPEIAFEETASLAPGSRLLDPLAGSGTAVRVASEQGHQAIGFDLDPLAVLMTKVWTTPISTKGLRERAASVAEEARQLSATDIELPWIDEDEETTKFIDYWFDAPQQDDLRKISSLLVDEQDPLFDAMRIALSRIIITKKRGASLAWDVSHSRPHKKLDKNDFPVISEFLKSVNFVARRLETQPPPGNVQVAVGDARHLQQVPDESVHAVITSPPYLNAIDYMRGHKFALVWFGHSISELRSTRSVSVGSAKNPDPEADVALAEELISALGRRLRKLPEKDKRIIERYALDIHGIVSEIHRVLVPRGKAVLVVGNSSLKGIFIKNSLLVRTAAEHVGLQLSNERERDLPTSRRYLPPPTEDEQSDLKNRMKTESIITFTKPKRRQRRINLPSAQQVKTPQQRRKSS